MDKKEQIHKVYGMQNITLKHMQWNKVINTFKKYNINAKMKDVSDFIKYFDQYKSISVIELFDIFEQGLDNAYKKYNPINNGNTKDIINMENILQILKTKDNYNDAIDSLFNLDKELSVFTTHTKENINKIIK